MIRKTKSFKVLTTVAMVSCMLWVSGFTAKAQTVNETEPNDSMETAQLIQANYETAAQVASGSRPNQYVVKGNTSKTDEDWYKVYLNAGIQYVTCNDNPFDYEIYNSDGNLVTSGTYIKSRLFPIGYPFNVSSNGFYYVKVKGMTSASSSYILLVGGPTYSVASCTVSLGSINMSGRDVTVPFDLRSKDTIPEGSVVYTISMSGVKSTSVNGITVKNLSKSSTVSLNNYSWDKNGLVSLNMPLKSSWQVIYKYNKNTTFTPKINLFFAYPVTSMYVNDIQF
ncbi:MULTISPECIES: hypothetical protein [Clostridia]|uniref:Pre-peptidase n=1 Tax=Lacrimispora xylanolytica TaxID=29375 RepID=A0ABY7AHF2_9FIRM|nr:MULTISPECIES: hypothetical protein [Clostridia]WAJ25218.1 hypothetical protein OW255_06845 [Lacrimispora xylanolytica]